MIKNIIVKLLFVFFIILNSFILMGEIPSTEREALIALYNSTNGDSWNNNSGWKTPPLHTDGFALPGTEYKWYGVTVDGHLSIENVTVLFLKENNLNGTIPNELGNLTELEEIYMSKNNLEGSVPSTLGNLSQLVSLYLEENSLTGAIPSELGNLSHLTYLMLNNNHLTGSIPGELRKLIGLSELYLNNNELSGTIPPGLGNLTNLRSLNLKENHLTGTIPVELSQLKSMQMLGLGGNGLIGSIPSELSKLSWLVELYLNDNLLSGGIPAELGNLTRLRLLRLESNKFTGGIPDLSKITGLQTLKLNFNRLTGTIPHGLGSLKSLTNLNLGNNRFNGSIPEELGNLTQLHILDLSYNELSGTIPANLENIHPNLNTGFILNLNYNCLSTTDAHLKVWLDKFNPGWEETQCSVETPKINLSRTSLNFGIEIPQYKISPQQVMITNEGVGTLSWSATCNHSWLIVTPESGTGDGIIQVSINPEGLTQGIYQGIIQITDLVASNSPQTIAVTLRVYNEGETAAPFGEFSTPVEGTPLDGSIPVTGWVLDDLGVESIKLYNGDSYIGDGVLVEGARPDVEAMFPDYPNNYKAGWGYMLLSNCLPNGGNGIYTLTAKAIDWDGHESILGTKTITIDNANSKKPFGALDTPLESGTISGKEFINYGWVLTPQSNMISVDGTTINVIIDGVIQGHPIYNNYRDDIADLFPGFANSNGAGGYYYIDTLKLKNGLHSIAWTVADSGGNEAGIGSRYFTVFNSNTGSNTSAKLFEKTQVESENGSSLDTKGKTELINKFRYEIKELDRMELKLSEFMGKVDEGFLLVGEELRDLPVGATLDKEKSMFYWLPGVGFVGEYEFLFQGKDKQGNPIEKRIIISVVPRR